MDSTIALWATFAIATVVNLILGHATLEWPHKFGAGSMAPFVATLAFALTFAGGPFILVPIFGELEAVGHAVLAGYGGNLLGTIAIFTWHAKGCPRRLFTKGT